MLKKKSNNNKRTRDIIIFSFELDYYFLKRGENQGERQIKTNKAKAKTTVDTSCLS